MKPVVSVEEALQQIEAYQGPPSEFQLVFPDSLNDPAGMRMAVITDKILGRDWMPDGFTQMPGYRIYRYKSLD